MSDRVTWTISKTEAPFFQNVVGPDVAGVEVGPVTRAVKAEERAEFWRKSALDWQAKAHEAAEYEAESIRELTEARRRISSLGREVSELRAEVATMKRRFTAIKDLCGA